MKPNDHEQDPLSADLARLRAQQERHEPPADQLQRILQRAVERRAQYEASPWRWLTGLWSPRLRVSFGGLALLSVCVASTTVGLLIWGRPSSAPQTAEVQQATVSVDVERRVPVRFMLPASGAKSVSVVGDFNAWQTEATRLDDADGDGVFVATLLLPRGSYGYMFVIDGERWTTDPYATNHRDDGFGQRNAVIRVN